jgi:hypothetical protein
MAATATVCDGMLVSASKLDASDMDGAPIAAGNSSFVMPGNFSKMANLSYGDTVETSAQVLTANPHRGSSNAAINTDVTSLSMLVTRLDSDATGELPVLNLSSPISIRIPLLHMPASGGSGGDVELGANESMGEAMGEAVDEAFEGVLWGGGGASLTPNAVSVHAGRAYETV